MFLKVKKPNFHGIQRFEPENVVCYCNKKPLTFLMYVGYRDFVFCKIGNADYMVPDIKSQL